MSDEENAAKSSEQTIFALDNYPKSFASTKPGDYRFRDFLELDEVDLEKLKDQLFEFCINRGDNTPPRTEYNGLEYLDSGWEWSVFKKDDKTVEKIPAGIFPEVNDPQYLVNTEETYKKIVASYPQDYVAKTTFKREEDTNVMEQEFVKGQSEFKVNLDDSDKQLLTNFKTFLEGTLKLVEDYQWLPDYWLTETPEGVLVRNVVLEDETKLFKIIDFAQYLDPSRMFPQLTERVISGQIKHLHKLLDALTNRMIQLPR